MNRDRSREACNDPLPLRTSDQHMGAVSSACLSFAGHCVPGGHVLRTPPNLCSQGVVIFLRCQVSLSLSVRISLSLSLSLSVCVCVFICVSVFQKEEKATLINLYNIKDNSMGVFFFYKKKLF